MQNVADPRRLNLHELCVRIDNSCPALQLWLDRLCAIMPCHDSHAAVEASGVIKPFDAAEVLRSVDPTAQPVGRASDFADVFGSGERFWVVGDHWGICQINLLKRQWRAWLLPRPAADLHRCIAAAVLWPLAQLLKTRGLELIRATSIEKQGWGALVLCLWEITPEIRGLESQGYRIVAWDWSVLRPRNGKVQLLCFPALENPRLPQLAAPLECRTVFVVEPNRRAVTRGRTLAASESAVVLRRAWPIGELPPNRKRPAGAAAILARHCRCVLVQLCKREVDFVQLVESSRRRTCDARKVVVAVSPSVRRASQAIKSFRPIGLR
jgi:hypothetical protein